MFQLVWCAHERPSAHTQVWTTMVFWPCCTGTSGALYSRVYMCADPSGPLWPPYRCLIIGVPRIYAHLQGFWRPATKTDLSLGTRFCCQTRRQRGWAIKWAIDGPYMGHRAVLSPTLDRGILLPSQPTPMCLDSRGLARPSDVGVPS